MADAQDRWMALPKAERIARLGAIFNDHDPVGPCSCYACEAAVRESGGIGEGSDA